MPGLRAAIGDSADHYDPIAILCSDLHLSHRPPAARAAEADWYEAMAKQLTQLRFLSRGAVGKYEWDVPILCAGDVFDRWNSPPELINFALEYLPPMYAIPGQHDLPWHGMSELRRSAYWTLVEAGLVRHLEPGVWHEIGPMDVHSFPWGVPLQRPLGDPHRLQIAVAHQFVWSQKGESRLEPWMPEDGCIEGVMSKVLQHYDAAVFGDNHCGFLSQLGRCLVMNCGGFMLRKANERYGRVPVVGVLHEANDPDVHPRCRVLIVKLDVEDEQWSETMDTDARMAAASEDLQAFLDDVGGLHDRSSLDFVELLRRRVNDPAALARLGGDGLARAVRELLLEVLDGVGGQS